MITTHILDTALGSPAGNVAVSLDRNVDGTFVSVGNGFTDSDGRLKTLVPAGAALEPGVYRIRFETGAYFAAKKQQGFYPYVEVVFQLTAPGGHYHVPLLLSPFGYSTYRGS